MNPALQILVALIGAFYIFAGFQVLSMMLLDRMMDGLLTVLEGKSRSPREKTRRVLLTGVAALTALSGAALATLSLWAVPLFLMSLIAQIVWLLWARTHYVPEDEMEAAGRRRTQMGTVLYALITLGVLWLGLVRGALAPLSAPVPLLVIAAVALAGSLYVLRFRQNNRNNALEDLADPDIDYPPPAPDGPQPRRVRIHPDLGAWALHDADDGRALPVFQYLPRSLAIRFDNWHLDFNDALDFNTPDARAVFPSQTALDVFLNTGASLADALREIYGADNVEGPTFPVKLVVRTDDPDGGSVHMGVGAGLKELLGVERGPDGILKVVFIDAEAGKLTELVWTPGETVGVSEVTLSAPVMAWAPAASLSPTHVLLSSLSAAPQLIDRRTGAVETLGQQTVLAVLTPDGDVVTASRHGLSHHRILRRDGQPLALQHMATLHVMDLDSPHSLALIADETPEAFSIAVGCYGVVAVVRVAGTGAAEPSARLVHTDKLPYDPIYIQRPAALTDAMGARVFVADDGRAGLMALTLVPGLVDRCPLEDRGYGAVRHVVPRLDGRECLVFLRGDIWVRWVPGAQAVTPVEDMGGWPLLWAGQAVLVFDRDQGEVRDVALR